MCVIPVSYLILMLLHVYNILFRRIYFLAQRQYKNQTNFWFPAFSAFVSDLIESLIQLYATHIGEFKFVNINEAARFGSNTIELYNLTEN